MRAPADVFADALEGTGSEHPAGTGDLLALVGRLHGLPGTAALAQAGARPEFRAQLRARLLDEAASQVSPATNVVPLQSRWNQSFARRHRLPLLSGAAAAVIAVTVVSVAASDSLPGNPLYPLKRGGESVEYALAGSDEARGKLELSFARTRLHEIDELTQHDVAWGLEPVDTPQAAGGSTVLAASTASRVVKLFADMDSEAVKGGTLLARSYSGDPRPGPLLAVQQFARDQEKALTSLSGRLAEPALSKATNSLAWAVKVAQQTTVVLASCTSTACPKATVGAVNRALDPAAASLTAVLPATPSPAEPSPSPSPSMPSPTGAAPSPSPEPSLPAVPSPAPTTATSLLAPPPVTATSPSPNIPPTSDQPSPTDTSTAAPTSTPVTTPSSTDSATAPTPPPSTSIVTLSPPPPSTSVPATPPPSVEPTTPAPTTVIAVPPTTPAPPPPTSAAPPSAPVVVPPTTSPAPPPSTPPTPPPTTTPPTRTGRPPVICLPGIPIIGGVCVRGSAPPGVGFIAL